MNRENKYVGLEQQYRLDRLAEKLCTTGRYAVVKTTEVDLPIDEQPTIEFDSRAVAEACERERQLREIEDDIQNGVDAEKARILAERQLPEFGMPFGQPPYWGD